MLLGTVLLIVGFVLFTNGMSGLLGVDKKSNATVNILGGSLLVVINIIYILQGDYFAAGTGFLFALTYLWIAVNGLFNVDLRPYGIFSLFVAVTTVPVTLMQTDIRMAAIWAAWGVLWFSGFVETVLNKNLGKVVPILSVLLGIFTGWIPGYLKMLNMW